MKNLDLTAFGVKRAEKIRWLYDLTAPDILDTLRSKSFTKILKNTDQILQRNNITFEHRLLNEADYQAWWQHYQQTMQEKGYDIIATPDWLQQKYAEDKTVGGFFFYQAGQLAGTSLYVRKDADVIGTFKTSLNVAELSHTHGASGALIDFVVIRELLQENLTRLSFGSMRNAFGVLNTIGNLEYKLAMGYLPIPKEETNYLDSTPVDDVGRVVFFGTKNGLFTLFAARPNDDQTPFSVARFKSDKIPFEVITYQK